MLGFICLLSFVIIASVHSQHDKAEFYHQSKALPRQIYRDDVKGLKGYHPAEAQYENHSENPEILSPYSPNYETYSNYAITQRPTQPASDSSYIPPSDHYSYDIDTLSYPFANYDNLYSGNPVSNQKPNEYKEYPTSKPEHVNPYQQQSSPFVNDFPDDSDHSTYDISSHKNVNQYNPSYPKEVILLKPGPGLKSVSLISQTYKHITESIPGTPGRDFPNFSSIPQTEFDCLHIQDVSYEYMYPDMETGCQVFHSCHPDGRMDSRLCPLGTIFNRETQTCDWWFNVQCLP